MESNMLSIRWVYQSILPPPKITMTAIAVKIQPILDLKLNAANMPILPGYTLPFSLIIGVLQPNA